MIEQDLEQNVERGSLKSILLARLSDVVFAASAIAITAMLFGTSSIELTKSAEAEEFAVTDNVFEIAFTSTGKMDLETSINQFRRASADLGAALGAAGAQANALQGLTNSDAYFEMVSHAGTEFLRGRMEEAQSELNYLRERANSETPFTEVDSARAAYERARIDYFEQLIASRKDEV